VTSFVHLYRVEWGRWTGAARPWNRAGKAVSVPPENQPVIYAAGLVVFERGQVGQGRGLGFVESHDGSWGPAERHLHQE
jgi:hypothetical protein